MEYVVHAIKVSKIYACSNVYKLQYEIRKLIPKGRDLITK